MMLEVLNVLFEVLALGVFLYNFNGYKKEPFKLPSINLRLKKLHGAFKRKAPDFLNSKGTQPNPRKKSNNTKENDQG
jgi:hypothetical protein